MGSTRPLGLPVRIAGRDTGLKTPIRKPLELAAGRHTVSFVMPSGKVYDFSVTISAGENLRFMKNLR